MKKSASGRAARVPVASKTRGEWSVADGKARFSELIERATKAPQTITRNGKPVAVVVGVEEWERKAARKGTLLEMFQSAPEGFADLDFTRAKDTARDIEL